MKANNLSISIPYKGCDKNCPYCVSKMTGYSETREHLFFKNLLKAKKMANIANVTSISITGKGEPTLNIEAIKDVCDIFNEYPIEIQTNGLTLAKNLDRINHLTSMGVDIFAISMDKLLDFRIMKEVIDRINHLDKIVRVTMNITDLLTNPDKFRFEDYIQACKEYGVEQFSLRQVTIANNTDRNKTHEWIEKHAKNNYYYKLIQQFEGLGWNNPNIKLIRSLPYGAKLYDVDGVSFTYFNYCIQDSSNGEDIRSLIYDGHLGTSWASKAGRIF